MSIRVIIDAGDPIESVYAANIEALHGLVQAELAARYLSQPSTLNESITPVEPSDDAWGCGPSSGGMTASEFAAQCIR